MDLRERLSAEPRQIASVIDHTNVDPTARRADIEALCADVRSYGFASAVVVPYHAPFAHRVLEGQANVVAVVGFPYGTQSTAAKVREVRDLGHTVDEVDMVMNRTAFANDDLETVRDDVAAVSEAAGDRPLKVIIESPTLSPEAITSAAKTVAEAGADFVKTAVGYDGPANVSDVEHIREAVGDDTAIKASGGIDSFDDAMAMIEAGATRIGASDGVGIVESTPD